MAIENLNHRTEHVGGRDSASVTVLDTGAEITAEDQAMLMALHSRSPDGVAAHLARLANVGSGKFMEQFYVGYGHKSIGDCGNTAVFVEGVSMLAAKAIQDSPLYSGQECSTRYIDFSRQPFINPRDSAMIDEVHVELRRFYVDNFEEVVDHVRNEFPDVENKGVQWEKATRARAFDVLRGFLPAGASTNLAWNTNLRQASDRLQILRNHPLPEVMAVADALQSGLADAYPNSFGSKTYPETEAYTKSWMSEDYYLNDDAGIAHSGVGTDFSRLDPDELGRFRRILEERPPKTELPKFLDQAGQIKLGFMLDFGSYRDIQRHRAVNIRMPLLTPEFGFEEWYLQNLPTSLQGEATQLLSEVEHMIDASISEPLMSAFDAQYGVPMGYRVPISLVGGIAAVTYLLELRSTTAVHPTLRSKAIEVGHRLAGALAHEDLGKINMALHLDESVADFDTKRGEDDITAR